MTPWRDPAWQKANQEYLLARMEAVLADFDQRAGADSAPAARRPDAGLPLEAAPATAGDPPAAGEAFRGKARDISAGMPSPPALDLVAMRFGLSGFEADVLAALAGLELLGPMADLARKQNQEGLPRLSFSSLFASLPEAHWSSAGPESPLRYWRLVESSGESFSVHGHLRLDESVLHFLAGNPQLDERLLAYIRPLPATESLAPSHALLAQALADSVRRGTAVILSGSCVEEKRHIAQQAATRLGRDLVMAPAALLPSASSELEALLRLWNREAVLSGTLLLLDAEEEEMPDGKAMGAAWAFVSGCRGPVWVACRERSVGGSRRLVLDVERPTELERRELWREALGEQAAVLDGALHSLAGHFHLGPAAIRRVAMRLPKDAAAAGLAPRLWEDCREETRQRLSEVARRRVTRAGWEDLVLPESQTAILKSLVAHVRRRHVVYEDWGFGAKSDRGLGITALFAGPSGTGKTLAAEVIAHELGLDLFHIDLAGVVSKYIGETEKNLRRVFDAAEDAGAVLLFDEADSLFGKRSEVKDSHDRYANIEVSYLLQRMESYRGLCVLTTNLKDHLDSAFLRRLRFIVNFPFPDPQQRQSIWRRIFPERAPVSGLDYPRLARLSVAGGNIRNMALNAAFLAADAGLPVGMPHLLHAARMEFAKTDKPLNDSEVSGWA